MKNKQFNTLLFFDGIIFMGSVQAHDPSEHTNQMEKPKCEAMKNMDHSKMEANDPVMIAMMKKCMSEDQVESNQGEEPAHSDTDDDKKKATEQHSSGHNH